MSSAGIEELVKSIAEWVAENAEGESIFLTPHPRHVVDAQCLLDHIILISGIDKEQVKRWVDVIADRKDKERKDAVNA